MLLREFMHLRPLPAVAHVNRVPLEAVLDEERADTLSGSGGVRQLVGLLDEFVERGMPSDSERAGYGPDTAVAAYVVVRLKILEVVVIDLHRLAAGLDCLDWFHALLVFVARAVGVMDVARIVVVNL